MKLRSKILLIFFITSLTPLLCTGIASFYLFNKSSLNTNVQTLEATASVQKARVNAVIAHYIERLKSISGRTRLRVALEAHNQHKREESVKEIQRILTDAVASLPALRVISIANTEGDIVASTNSEEIGTNINSEESFAKGREQDTLVGLFKDQSNMLFVRLSGPLILDDKYIGVVVVDATAENLSGITEDYTGLGMTGESLLVSQAANQDIIFFTPLRFDADAALKRRVTGDQLDIAASAALSQKETLFFNIHDYRHKEVIAVTRFIEGVNWGLVVKKDRDEVLAPMRDFQRIFIAIGGGIVLVTCLLVFYLSNFIVMPIRKLTFFVKRYSSPDFNEKIDISSGDEIGELASAFNVMVERMSSTNHNMKNALGKSVENTLL